MTKDTEILNYINANKLVYTEKMSQSLGMSESTVRRALGRLSQKRKIVRFHGGASVVSEIELYSSLYARFEMHIKEKEEIAQKAAGMIKYGSSVIMLGGTTVACMCKYIANKGLTVITNSILVLDQLKQDKNTKVIVLGGEYNHEEAEMNDSLTINSLQYLSSDYLFTSAMAFDDERGFLTAHVNSINFYRQCFASTQKVFMLIDSSKYQQQNIAVIARFDDIDCLICDNSLPQSARDKLTQKGVNLIILD
ncbi:MAG: DeoR/GlpR family DNA-binding transcription regulator [Defluviitaleaceae bacterium]|nr:DeoR/GlpR family DNA-binding transcription regulator [Defluviitaleaceae bacterium]